MNPWDQIKQELKSVLSAESFQNWVSRTSFAGCEGNTLLVAVPDSETKAWMESEYTDPIFSIIRNLRLVVDSVVYRAQPLAGRQTETPDVESAVSLLNPKFTFDNFVVGACNQFAHAAARSVATNPSRSYNPLFIYGGVGMGKTHLMHAVGRALMDAYPAMRVIYTSSERFMNDMITSIRLDRLAQFHQRYRSVDALLVDDIQLIGNKERTQEEFFHAFNELHDQQKQIVISCDSPPRDIPGLVERLRSRFEWGLLADIQPPDLETKMAILIKKAAADRVELPQEVCVFMASKTKSNIRELEGALIKLMAYSSLTGSTINLAMAQQVLKHMFREGERKVTIEAIMRTVAERFSIKPAQLKEKSNAKNVVYPRQIAMYLVKDLTSASLPEIGRAFGGKHHTTVMHSIQKIERLRRTDPDLHRLVQSLTDSLT